MKLGLMQPYFFPYIGYFSLIERCDHFIIFDTPQFVRRGWTERNRIINDKGTLSYIKVPLVKAPRHTSIIDIQIDNSRPWKENLISQLQIYRDKAPYFVQVMNLLSNCFKDDYCNVSKLNEMIIKAICGYLGINTKIQVLSEIDLNLAPANMPDEWALNICKQLNVTEYVNATGGQDIYDGEKYSQHGVNLYFIEQPEIEYPQLASEFESGLSIIDMMMFNSPEKILSIIKQSSLISTNSTQPKKVNECVV